MVKILNPKTAGAFFPLYSVSKTAAISDASKYSGADIMYFQYKIG